MLFESWLIGEIDDPVTDIKAHRERMEELLRKVLWAEKEQIEKIRQEVNWRLQEIVRLKKLMEQNKQKQAG